MLRALRTSTFPSRWKMLTMQRCNEIRHVTRAAYPTLMGNSNNKNPKPQRRKFSTINISHLERTISRTGRLPENIFELIFNTDEIQGKPSNQVLLSLIPLCGEGAVAEMPEVKIDLVKKIWNYIKTSGVKLDVSHYNTLLRVYLKNEYDFSPPEILTEMEKDNILPNRVTYLHLMTHYCQKGDLVGASDLLEDMKKQSLALNENIFHTLIFGHCVAKDVEGAESIMGIMKEKNLTLNSSTYATFLCGLATCGDVNKFEITLQKCTEDNIKFRIDQLHDIIYYLALNGQNSQALKILNSNSNVLSSGFSPLLMRLLRKQMYNMCFQIMKLCKEKNIGSVDTFERIIFSHLAEFDSLENVRRIAGEWEKCGLKTNFLTHLLYHTLKRKYFPKSLEILNELHEMGQPVKELYFWPIAASAAQEGQIENILHIITVMQRDFNLKISKFFLGSLIFNNFPKQPRREKFLIVSMNRIGLGNNLILDAYISSCIYNKRTDVILQLSDFGNVINNVEGISKLIAEDHSLEDPVSVVHVIQNLIVTAINRRDRNVTSQNEEQSDVSSNEVKSIDQIGQDLLDSFVLKIVSDMCETRKNFGKKILQELANQGLSISKAAGDQIIAKWNDSETSDIIDKLTQNEFDVSRFTAEKYSSETDESDSTTDVYHKFLKFCKEKMIDEAENIIKDHRNILDEAFVPFITALKNSNNEEKLIQYLKSTYECIMEDQKRFRHTLFLTKELINKGFLKEACSIIGNSKFGRVDKLVLLEILKPVIEKLSLEEINLMVNNNNRRGITISYVIKCYQTRKDWDKILKLIESLDYERIKAIAISKIVIRHMINDGATELIEKLIGIMEMKNPPGRLWLDLLYAYACVGDVKRAREYLDKVELYGVFNMPCMNYLEINDEIKVSQAFITMLLGDKRFNKTNLYENLIEMYEAVEYDPSKGLELWEQIQEENIIPSPIFLFYLWRLLKKKNVDIPFSEPSGMWLDCVINSELPGVLRKQLLAQGIKENFHAIQKILIDGIRYGNVTSSILRKILGSLEGSGNIESMRNIIKNCIKLAEYKDALTEGGLYEYVMKNEKSENRIVDTDRIPHSFLCECLFIDGFGKVPGDAAQVILWAHFHEITKDSELSKIYEKRVENIIQDRTVLGEVLRFAPYLKDKNIILNFLISRNVFDSHEMTKEAKYVLQMELSKGFSSIFGRKFSNKNFEGRVVPEERSDDQMGEREAFHSAESSETVAAEDEEKLEETPRSTVSV